MSFLVCWKYEFSADTMPNQSPMSIHDFIVSEFQSTTDYDFALCEF